MASGLLAAIATPTRKYWEASVNRVSIAISGAIIVALLGGCGSSSKSTTAASHPTSVANQSSYAPSTTSSTSNAAAALITTKQGKLGTILAYGPKRLTVYLFEGDKGGASSCSGECASVWPPVSGHPQASGQAVSSHLGTITTAGGTTQVTYNGHPLYLYAKDKDDGDTYGQGIKSFGASWYVLTPSGNKVDTS
jgi:predicted lipoprotein with Yx(FWY)xxD motif